MSSELDEGEAELEEGDGGNGKEAVPASLSLIIPRPLGRDPSRSFSSPGTLGRDCSLLISTFSRVIFGEFVLTEP